MSLTDTIRHPTKNQTIARQPGPPDRYDLSSDHGDTPRRHADGHREEAEQLELDLSWRVPGESGGEFADPARARTVHVAGLFLGLLAVGVAMLRHRDLSRWPGASGWSGSWPHPDARCWPSRRHFSSSASASPQSAWVVSPSTK